MGLSMHDVCIIQHGSSMMHRILAMILTLYDTGIQYYSIYMNVMSRINWHHVLELLRQINEFAFQAMQCLASCTTQGKRVSLITFDCPPGHAVLGILSYPSKMGEFDCTPRHAVLGILCYPSQTSEFDCLRLHPRPCSAWHPVQLEG